MRMLPQSLDSPCSGISGCAPSFLTNAPQKAMRDSLSPGSRSANSVLMLMQSTRMVIPNTATMRVSAARKLNKYKKPCLCDGLNDLPSRSSHWASFREPVRGLRQGGSFPKSQMKKSDTTSRIKLSSQTLNGPHVSKISQACCSVGAQYAARMAVPMKKLTHSAMGTRNTTKYVIGFTINVYKTSPSNIGRSKIGGKVPEPSSRTVKGPSPLSLTQ
mmetsp:Transcript_104447/g.292654  ORF Transcript_104447/g.292654 Transcript_104447/m.292654 type:complete len:216 (-) Transcript_104447:583-1230(-)